MALTGLALAGATLLLVGLATALVQRGGEAEQLRVRYGHLIIDVAAGVPAEDGVAIDVRRFEDLLQVATRAGATILHREGACLDEYAVRAGAQAYRYRATKAQPAVGAAPAPVVEVRRQEA